MNVNIDYWQIHCEYNQQHQVSLSHGERGLHPKWPPIPNIPTTFDQGTIWTHPGSQFHSEKKTREG